jgi:HD superfamily phosphohydrolase
MEALRRRHGPKSQVSERLDNSGAALKCAALLHDIGHAPFSHLLERAFDGSNSHEVVTVDLIRSPGTSIGATLKEHGIDAASVASIVRKDFAPKFIVDIVSSQLDADRMDYLLRDSLSTGTTYGHYDVEWLLHSMLVAATGPIEDATGNASEGSTTSSDVRAEKLCLDKSKGMFAAERFVLARMQMYQQVYLHRVTRGYEVLLLNLFKAAQAAAREGHLPADTPPVVGKYFRSEGKLEANDWLVFDESQVLAAFHVWAHTVDQQSATIKRLSSAFLNRARLYRAVELKEVAPDKLMRLGVDLEQLEKEHDGVTPRFAIDTPTDTPYKGLRYQGKRGPLTEEALNESIFVTADDTAKIATQIENRSVLLSSLDATKFDVHRLYYDAELESKIKPMLRKAGLIAA